MKKIPLLFTLTFCLLSFAACNEIEDTTAETAMTASLSTLPAVSENTTIEAETKTTAKKTTASQTTASTASDTETTETQTTVYTDIQTEESEPDPEETETDNGERQQYQGDMFQETQEYMTSGEYDYDMTDAELIALADSFYGQAKEQYYKFVFEGAYSMDYESEYYTSSGETMYKITDSSINSVSDVENDYEKYFSDKYESPIPMHYTSRGGEVYYIQSDRGGDAAYISTKITGIEQHSSDEVFFSAVSDYSDGTTRTDTFSLCYSRTSGTWKIGKFRLPN